VAGGIAAGRRASGVSRNLAAADLICANYIFLCHSAFCNQTDTYTRYYLLASYGHFKYMELILLCISIF
jgi:hypothetical protein